jgi:hypothetical protein
VRLAVAQAAAYWEVDQGRTFQTVWVEAVSGEHLGASAVGAILEEALVTAYLVEVQGVGGR